jgi:hypothetical protein
MFEAAVTVMPAMSRRKPPCEDLCGGSFTFTSQKWTCRVFVPVNNLYNIYEADTGVKHHVKHTSPVTAQVRVLATSAVDPPRMRPHLRSCCRSLLVRSKSRAAINHLSGHVRPVRSVPHSLRGEAGRPITNPRHESLCCKPGRPRFDAPAEELRVIDPVT